MKTTFDFLADEIYLPGYMALTNPDFGRGIGGYWATFDFNVREPPVVRGDQFNYFTPRGLHLCASQAGIAMVEAMVRDGLLGDMDIPQFRGIVLGSRVKMVELYQKFRRELGVERPIPGRLDVERLRLGGTPILRIGFDFGNKAVHGNFVSVIASHPVHPTNADIMRVPA